MTARQLLQILMLVQELEKGLFGHHPLMGEEK
jgi:hypothetical protein